MDYTDKQIEVLLERLHTGEVTPQALPADLYHATADYLKRGIYKGYGTSYDDLLKGLDSGDPAGYNLRDLELLGELRENIYMFSAAKTYQQVKDMTQALISAEGTILPYPEFKDKALDIFKQYNETWLKTEYDTAIGQAQEAVKWGDIIKNKEVLPYLRYSAVIDPNTSVICRPLDGIVAPVDDPIWRKIAPLNHFNCRCLIEQITREEGIEEETPGPIKKAKVEEVTGQMQEVFKMNAGLDGYVFKENHPYFVVPKKDRQLAANNFNLPIPATDKPGTPTLEKGITFTPAKTIKEANDYAKDILGLEYADYKGLDIGLANDTNYGIYQTRKLLPKLPTRGVGAIQNLQKEFKTVVTEAFIKSDSYEKYLNTFGKERADKILKRAVRTYTPKAGKGTYAFSLPNWRAIWGNAEVDLSKYKGVYINKVAKRTSATVKADVEKMIERKWFTQGSGDMAQIVNHELGHELDDLLKINRDPDFLVIFQREHAATTEVLTDRLSKYGATAGGKHIHLRHEMIAEAWAEYTTSKKPRELAKEIGELILKRYYEDHVQGTPGVTYKLWVQETIKKIGK